MIVPSFDPKIDYLDLYLKLYQQNNLLMNNFTEGLSQRNELLQDLVVHTDIKHLRSQATFTTPLQNANDSSRDDLDDQREEIKQSDMKHDLQQQALSFINHNQNSSLADSNGLDDASDSTNRWYISGRKRHFRRCNNEIKKGYTCPYSTCGKNYGSEGSLNLHMKIKHQAGSKTEREKYAREIVLIIRSGHELNAD